MDGGSLDQYGTIPEQVLGRIAVGVVRGLSYLSSLKIMHRDIKPSNILVNTHGAVKLCDFGVSVQLLTSMAKTFIGSNAYMAPERIMGEEYGLHSDIWSLGISIFELAIGRFPYLNDGTRANTMLPIELLQCIVNEKPPQLPPQSFSAPFVEFIGLCMQKAPKSRPGIEGLLRHPFILMNEDNLSEVVGPWVIFMLDQFRIMKRYPSDTSLSSASSHSSGHYSAGVHPLTHHSSSTSLEQMDT
jgi:mitogen-activated protein kinase kinase 5